MKTQREIYLEGFAAAEAAAQAYYTGESTSQLTDLQYDTLVTQLIKLGEANSWTEHHSLQNAVAAGFTEAGADVQHRTRMLSLDKAQDVETLTKFIGKMSDEALNVEPKMDGLAIVAHYKNGKLAQVVTRGNSRIGKDVTARAKKATIKGLPHQVNSDADFEARGEVLMSYADFATAQTYRAKHGRLLFENPRNAVAGVIQSKDDSRLDGMTLTFALYDVIIYDGNNSSDDLWVDTDSYNTRMSNLPDGFIPVSSLMPQYEEDDTVLQIVEKFGEDRKNFPYPTDGSVVKVDSYSYREQVGNGEKHPRWAVAYKYEEPTAETILRSITRDVGRTGAISYVANFDAVQFDSKVSKATLNNVDFIENFDLHLGDRIIIRKANGVIPEVVAVDYAARDGQKLQKYEAPTTCPKCGEELDTTSSVVWRCGNFECAKANVIIYAVSRDNLDIRDISTAIITAMLDSGLIEDVTDLYKLSEAQISAVTTKGKDGRDILVGNERARKIYQNIQKSKDVPLNRILSSLGVRFLGKTFGRRFAKHFQSFDLVTNATVAQMQEVEGVKDKAAVIVAEFQKNKSLLSKYRTAGFTNMDESNATPAGSALAGEAVVITGSIPGYSREQAKELIESNGGVASSSVSGKTTLLVAPADERDSSKAKKAIAQGTPIITPEEFLKRLK